MDFRVFLRTSRVFGKEPIKGANSNITLKSLLKSFDPEELVIICDNTTEEKYLELASIFPIVYRTKLGNSASFRLSLKLTEVHKAKSFYFVEDDHLHLPNQKEWIKAGLDLFDFVSLYDHPDKYFFEMYKGLKRKIKITPVGYFASTPSTVMTFSCLASTLEKTKDIFLRSDLTGDQLRSPRDHEIFTVLEQQGYTLGTPIPGRSTHCEKYELSPYINWGEYIKSLSI